MNLNEEIKRIQQMMDVVKENHALYRPIQKIINSELYNILQQSEEWGLGEMDELEEIESIDEINVVNISDSDIFVDIRVNSNRRDFDNTISALQYEIRKFIPNAKIYLNDIVDNRTFGPGIDW